MERQLHKQDRAVKNDYLSGIIKATSNGLRQQLHLSPSDITK